MSTDLVSPVRIDVGTFVGPDECFDDAGPADVPRAARGYFSFRSPYSWIVNRRLTHDPGGASAPLRWVPLVDPAGVRRPASVRCASLTMADPGAHRWTVPHLAALAAPPPVRAAYVDEIFRRRWVEGEDVTFPAVVSAVARDHGFTLEDAWLRGESAPARGCLSRLRAQATADGVFAVPFLVCGPSAGHDRGGRRCWGVEAVVNGVRRPS